ncbi:MAG: hypothetical protein K2X66_19200 [Cyanobacteria bacterium]|nr:hypothetical protein [Cyanobacteriota bacterium]
MTQKFDKGDTFLNKITVATPCPADWNQMVGDEMVRFCESCALSVYNLSSLTTHEAEALILKHEGRLCVRFFRRSDGTMMTQDCPVGLQIVYRRSVKLKDLSRNKRMKLSGKTVASILLVTVAGVYSLVVQAEPLNNLKPLELKPVEIVGGMLPPGFKFENPTSLPTSSTSNPTKTTSQDSLTVPEKSDSKEIPNAKPKAPSLKTPQVSPTLFQGNVAMPVKEESKAIQPKFSK